MRECERQQCAHAERERETSADERGLEIRVRKPAGNCCGLILHRQIRASSRCTDHRRTFCEWRVSSAPCIEIAAREKFVGPGAIGFFSAHFQAAFAIARWLRPVAAATPEILSPWFVEPDLKAQLLQVGVGDLLVERAPELAAIGIVRCIAPIQERAGRAGRSADPFGNGSPMETAESQQPECPDREGILDRVLEVTEPRQVIEIDILFAPRNWRGRPDNRHVRLRNWRQLLRWNRGGDRLGGMDGSEQLQLALALGRPSLRWPRSRPLCRFSAGLGLGLGRPDDLGSSERTTYAHLSGGTTAQRGGRRGGGGV